MFEMKRADCGCCDRLMHEKGEVAHIYDPDLFQTYLIQQRHEGAAWQRDKDARAAMPSNSLEVGVWSVPARAATALQKTEETTCACGHEKRQHIYEEGACRPGFACELACDKYEPKQSDGGSEKHE